MDDCSQDSTQTLLREKVSQMVDRVILSAGKSGKGAARAAVRNQGRLHGAVGFDQERLNLRYASLYKRPTPMKSIALGTKNKR